MLRGERFHTNLVQALREGLSVEEFLEVWESQERQRLAALLPAAQATAERLYQAARAATRDGRPGHGAWDSYHVAQKSVDWLYLHSQSTPHPTRLVK